MDYNTVDSAKKRKQITACEPENHPISTAKKVVSTHQKLRWWKGLIAIKPGRALEQLRIPAPKKKQSSAGKPAKATPCATEPAPRCTKTLELPNL